MPTCRVPALNGGKDVPTIPSLPKGWITRDQSFKKHFWILGDGTQCATPTCKTGFPHSARLAACDCREDRPIQPRQKLLPA
jgi:hypothetical protein